MEIRHAKKRARNQQSSLTAGCRYENKISDGDVALLPLANMAVLLPDRVKVRSQAKSVLI